MYELSDKMSKRTATADSARNIEDCVALMSSLALPLCWQKQSEFCLEFLAETPLCLGSKMQTLNRQLQELVAWTNIEGQTTAPHTFIPTPSLSLPSLNNTPRNAPISAAMISPRGTFLVSTFCGC
jgi:hypothetical protein